MFGLTFVRQVDVGHLLTIGTLVIGFAGWFSTTLWSRHQKSKQDARNGALRLLLKILREELHTGHGGAVTLEELKEKFESAENRKYRQEYCGRNWLGDPRFDRYTDEPHLEADIYRLHWEGKINFTPEEKIVFRVDRGDYPVTQFRLTGIESDQMLEIFKEAVSNNTFYGLEALAKLCMRVAPDKTEDQIHKMLQSEDTHIRMRAASIIGTVGALAVDKRLQQ